MVFSLLSATLAMARAFYIFNIFVEFNHRVSPSPREILRVFVPFAYVAVVIVLPWGVLFAFLGIFLCIGVAVFSGVVSMFCTVMLRKSRGFSDVLFIVTKPFLQFGKNKRIFQVRTYNTI